MQRRLTQTRYPVRSWLDPRIEVRRSPIDRFGLFTAEPIGAGETVIRLGGRLIDDAELEALKQAFQATGDQYSCAAVGEGRHLLQSADDPLRFGNHGCDPNLWMAAGGAERARRDIAAGAELTVDYATHTADPGWRMDCRCGSPFCRGRITGEDWRLPQLQARYGAHWTPILLERIRASLSHLDARGSGA